MRKNIKNRLTVGLIAGGIVMFSLGDCPIVSADSIDNNQAQETLREQEQAIADNAAKNEQSVNVKNMNVRVNSIVIKGNKQLSETDIRFLLPELKKETVNIHTLSKEIQLVNETGAITLGTNFCLAKNGGYDVTVSVIEGKNEHFILSAGNNGTGYATGDWRTTISYINSNLSNHADTLGLAFLTSPNKIDKLQQIALSYRFLLPSAQDSMMFSAGYSNTNLGDVLENNPLLSADSKGKNYNLGLHYQHNFSYTSRNKDILDIGYDYKNYKNDFLYEFSGAKFSGNSEYNLNLLSATYIHNDRTNEQAFSYYVGTAANIGNVNEEYRLANSIDNHFILFKGGLNYQRLLSGDWQIGFRLNGQYSGDRLAGSERFGLGGKGSIRGFNEKVVAEDCGIAGTLEFFTPQVIDNGRMYLFTDMGRISSNAKNVNSQNLASAGIGFRYADNKNGWYADLNYAKILRDFDEGTAPNYAYKRWNLMVSKAF